MHSIADIGTNVPAFLGKLWKMVEDPETDDLITWSLTGNSFVIKDEIRFARELLPMYYKHNNMASFIRQLNMYGFHKIVSPDAGSMKLETPDEIKFTHPYFVRGHPYLIDNIKRKIGISKVIPGQLGEKTPQVINKVLTDVRQMKGRQENLDSRLTAMKLENGALWRELSLLRQKHMKQQQIVNKLIQFLVTIVHQNHSGFSVKRKFPRMLQHHKSTKHCETDDAHEHVNSSSNSPLGPVIHELDPAEALLETVVEEVEAETPTDVVTDYFLNPANNENDVMMSADDELPQSVDLYTLTEPKVETIIGLPEDTLIPGVESQLLEQNTSSNKRTYSTSFANRKLKKNVELQRPKYLKVITTKRPRKNIEKLQKKKPIQSTQKQMEKNLLQKIQNNKLQMERNKRQLNINTKEIERNEEEMSENENQQEQNDQFENNQQQELLLQALQKQPQPPSESVITIPFDSGTSGDVITEVEPLYGDNSTGFNVPAVVIEVKPEISSPAKASPSVVSSEDVLISSPMVINDPETNAQGESVLIPSQDMLISSPMVINDSVTNAQGESVVVSSPDPNSEMQVACVNDVTPASLMTRNEMDSHIETVQSDLDSLKELLRSEGISLDANTLLGCFSDDPLSYNFSDPVNSSDPNRPKDNIEGNELMTYSPSLFDLTDLMTNEWSSPSSPSEYIPADEEDLFAEVNTPQFMPLSPSFPTSGKKRKK